MAYVAGTPPKPPDTAKKSFFDMHSHGFVRVATAVPRVALCDPRENAARIEKLYKEACAQQSAVCCFPELSVSGYALDDLLQQDALQEECLEALASLKRAAKDCLLLVGAPLRFDGRLFNCAVALQNGRCLGIVPKSYLPNFREFYEARQFAPARLRVANEVMFLGETVPFTPDVIFRSGQLCVGCEVCQDVWVPTPPSVSQCWRGATIVCNLSASNITIGKAAYRSQLVQSMAAKNYCCYAYCSAGQGESTNDVAWDGQSIVYECGDFLAQSPRFAEDATLTYADVDLDRIEQDRSRDATWSQNGADYADVVQRVRVVEFSRQSVQTPLTYRVVEKRPYVPSDKADLDQRCYECYNIQVSGLVQRMRSSGLKKLVIGVSGGLDSTHALLVCVQALDKLKLPRSNCLAYTMPGFATGEKTKSYATELMERLGVTAHELDIRPSCEVMLKDLGHPYSKGEPVYDVTFENVQAGERTNHLFRLANHQGAFVVGTGDLSELALGWCTYGVGDHMSHYGVNASVPKSLIQCVIQWVIDADFVGKEANDVLAKILSVEISPELIPGAVIQSTEDTLGPYDLHDFQLYQTTRRGFAPAKSAFLAMHAFRDSTPSSSILEDRAFDLVEVLKHQRTFLLRFFLTSQFKRTCVPNAPKVGDGGSLSPRGDWRAPSDSSWAPWERAWARCVAWARDTCDDADVRRGLGALAPGGA
jgi:NAD+ synthase (glutamine-hydrolysing)